MARVSGQGSSAVTTTRKRAGRSKFLAPEQGMRSGHALRRNTLQTKGVGRRRSEKITYVSQTGSRSANVSSARDDSEESFSADEENESGSGEDSMSDDNVEDASSNAENDSKESQPSAQKRNGTRTKSSNSGQTSRGHLDSRMSYYFVKDLDIKKLRREESLARFRYLLSLGDLFRRFVDYKAQKDDDFREILNQATKENQKASNYANRSANARSKKNRRSSRIVELDEEDALLAEAEEEPKITVFSESPGFVHGELRNYQIDGLNWLISLYLNRINGILADEMGLGKTFQCISFLAYLRHVQNTRGPHFIIVPKSTVQNWAREFHKWTPEVDVLVVAGDKEERANLMKSRVLSCEFDVCVTSFELVIKEKSAFQKIAWQYVIVDEAHRIKNEESILSKIMRVLFSRHRLLITGTPLQNNLHELWALLNFLLPDVFADANVFDEWFARDPSSSGMSEEDKNSGHNGETELASYVPNKFVKDKGSPDSVQNQNKSQDEVIEQLRSLLSPFLMRRVKRDVEHTLLPKREINLYVGMTEMQIEWYQKLLEKDIDAVNNTNKAGGSKEGKMRLLNVVMQLRKCCNHPYLFEGAEPGPPFTTDEHLVQNSGKMIILDKLLSKLKAQGSRVLIFSQMGRMLDILEDYCALRDYEYCRIDGSTVHEDRISAIDEYNSPNSNKFLFLLTTRAGGLGINLTTADQVIIYDSDWNPQADLQAMDRAHRIGQTKQVFVYRFVVEHAIEEKVLERAAHKLRLDQLVIQQGGSNRNSAQEKAKAAASKEELANMIRHGAQEVFDKNNKAATSDLSIEDIISAGEERTKQLNGKYSELGLDELRKFTFDKPPTDQALIISRNQKNGNDDEFRHHHRRARNHALYHDEVVISESDRDGKTSKISTLRAPKQLPLHDFQFFPKELHELQRRELAWYRKMTGIRLSSEDYSSDEEDESEDKNEEIENAQPLTDEEQTLKNELVSRGFQNFSKRDFYHFLNLVVKHGGSQNRSEKAVDEMCKSWPEKPAEEIKRYYKVFFERYREIADHERYMNLLEAGESKARKINHRTDLLKRRIEESKTPLSSLTVTQPSGGSATRHRFSEANDRFLLVQMNKFGLDTPSLSERIRDNIRTSGLFDFDWYFMSRSATEIGRRCTSLLNIMSKENDGLGGAARGSKRKGRPPTLRDGQEPPKRSKSSDIPA